MSDVGSVDSVESPVSQESVSARLDRWETNLSDYVNPIVVKELRQSLKSRQFFYTYAAMLMAVWVWSIVGVVLLLPGANFFPAGKPLLFGYFLILVVPAVLVIPLSVHRSLASETDEDTYELLSITTLGARQIIFGKLAGGMLQFMLLAGILSPCCAFAYLLRGIEIRLVATMFGSVALLTVFATSAGLFLAALVRARMGQMLVLLAQFGISMGLLFTAVPTIVEWLTEASLLPFYTSTPLVALVIAGTLVVSRLMLRIAAARLTPVSENRSTAVRVTLLQVQFILIAGFILVALQFPESDIWWMGINQLTVLWAVAGAIMIGESPELSPRVRRALPISFVGRAVLGFFHPGPMSGLLFALAGLLSSLIVLLASAIVYLPAFQVNHLLSLSLLNFGYVATSWTIVCVLVELLRKQVREGWVLSMALMVIVMFSASMIPYTIATILSGGREITYDFYQFINPAFTYEQLEVGALSLSVPWLVASIGLVCIFCILPFAGQNLHLPTLATPERIQQEYSGDMTAEEEIDPLKI